MKLATAYYPDYYPQEEWFIDLMKMNRAGIKQIRIGEFAWALMEPEDGTYNWEWLDQSIALAEQFDIEVILCTPTACPPIWLIEKYPDVLPVSKQGRTIGFGARQHRSYSSLHYQHYALRIVERMAERYGHHKNVVAWQMDNEYGGEVKSCYSAGSRKAFQQYLLKQYGSIEQLNKRWGTAFWSQTYTDFAQIPLPSALDSEVMMWHHPSLELEFRRFSSKVITDFNNKQLDILRKHTDVPLTTNGFMFNWGDNVHWGDLFQNCDTVGIDVYSEDPVEISFFADACRSLLQRPFWMMEYGTTSPNLYHEMENVQKRGCELFCLFKFKLFPWGQEQESAKTALLTITDEPTSNYNQVHKWAEEQMSVGHSDEAVRSGVAVYYDFDSSWAYSLSKSDPMDYFKYVCNEIYRHVYSSDASIDIIFSPQPLVGITTLVVALQIIYTPELEATLISFVEQGGNLIVTEDLFRKNTDNVYLRELPQIFSELFHWHEPNFVPDAIQGNETILISHSYGKGKATMIRRNINKEDLHRLVHGE